MKNQKLRRENTFMKTFRQKQKIFWWFQSKGVVFSKAEFNEFTIKDIIKVGNERLGRVQLLKKENNAATVIQKYDYKSNLIFGFWFTLLMLIDHIGFKSYRAYKKYVDKVKYKEYEEHYKLSQERIIAAMKIQLFYRSVKQAKKLEKQIEEK